MACIYTTHTGLVSAVGGGGGEEKRRKKGIFYLYKPVKVIQTKIRSVSLLLIFFD